MLNKKTTTQTSSAIGKPFTIGKNYFTLISNGIKREYYVHVPLGYSAAFPVPLVFMLHGHGSNGDDFYTKSGWKEVGDRENIITVFPSSYHYNIIDDGVFEKNAKVWNKYGTEFCPGETPCDDVFFLSQIIDEMKRRYNILEKQIYVVGFSNGGCMAARCAIELSDHLAAVVASSGSLPADTRFVPKRCLPVQYQFGNEDAHIQEKFGITHPLPMDFTQLFASYPQIKQNINSYISSYGLQSFYSVSGNPREILIASYKGLSGSPDNFFNFALIEGMGHAYPKSNAEINWKWMRKFRLP